MKRNIDKTLNEWKVDTDRKVLLIRGARQVGKTYSVRNHGRSFEFFIEVNFEENDEVKSFFEQSLDPYEIIKNLSAYYNIPIIPGKTLLFFDEVQACKRCLRSLRFFYEKLPKLHVIAAGSLLEFALAEIPSFGVGRISSAFMYPMTFTEFLEGIGKDQLVKILHEGVIQGYIDVPFHNRLLENVRYFIIIGGMPAVVDSYRKYNDLRKCMTLLDDLALGFQDDFSKYGKNVSIRYLNDTFQSAAIQAGRKFKYSSISHDVKHYELKKTLDLLVKSGLVYKIYHTGAQGMPLGAQKNERRFKVMIFDVGIHQRLMDLDLSKFLIQNIDELINKGTIAEVFAGQEFIGNSNPHIRPQLYYWHREARNSNAEVDYVIQNKDTIVPVEIKAGTRGAMQSMYLFLKERNLDFGIRLSQENFSTYKNIVTMPVYTAGCLINKERNS